jgi:hypothetical protein
MSDVVEDLDAMFTQMIAHQQKKVRDEARRRVPRITDDDIEQPHDFPELANDPTWQYEDGVLAGYRAAHMAMRAELKRHRR